MARAQLEQQIEEFLQGGGTIDQVPRGISGWDSSKGSMKPGGEFVPKPQSRTPLDHLLVALDTRRNTKRQKPKKKSRLPSPRNKILYDDFGEPVRRVWVDD